MTAAANRHSETTPQLSDLDLMRQGHYPVAVAQSLASRLSAEIASAEAPVSKLMDLMDAADLAILTVTPNGGEPARHVLVYKVGYNPAPLHGRRLPPVPCPKLQDATHEEFEHLTAAIRTAVYAIDENNMTTLNIDPALTLWKKHGVHVMKHKSALKTALHACGKRSKLAALAFFLPGNNKRSTVSTATTTVFTPASASRRTLFTQPETPAQTALDGDLDGSDTVGHPVDVALGDSPTHTPSTPAEEQPLTQPRTHGTPTTTPRDRQPLGSLHSNFSNMTNPTPDASEVAMAEAQKKRTAQLGTSPQQSERPGAIPGGSPESKSAKKHKKRRAKLNEMRQAEQEAREQQRLLQSQLDAAVIEEPTFVAAEMDPQQQQSQPPSRDERDARQPQVPSLAAAMRGAIGVDTDPSPQMAPHGSRPLEDGGPQPGVGALLRGPYRTPQPDAVRLQRECEELLERVQAMESSRKMHELGMLLYTSLEPKNGAQVAGRLVSMMLQQQPIEVLVQACCDAVYRDDLEAKAKAAVHAQTVQHPYHPQQQHQRQQPQQQQQWRLQQVAPRHDENQTESQHGAPAGSSTPTAAGGSATEEGARLVATPGADDCNALKQHKETTAIIHVSGCPKTTGRSPGGAWTILYMDPNPDCDIPLSMELDVSAGHVRTSRSPDVTSTLALQTAAITDCL